jgi:uncharacterized damage-inducible protein DinB
MIFVNFLPWLSKTSCMKRKILALAICFLLIISYQGFTQTVEAVKEQMVKDWERAKVYTIEYLNTMPADKYSFKATDSTRSFAQQMLHLSLANAFLTSNVSGQKLPAGFDFGLQERASAQTKDSVMYFVTTSYDFARDAVKNSDISKWGEKKKLFGRFEETNFAILNKAFEHQGHHRGQSTIYIRLQGIKPPEERLF